MAAVIAAVNDKKGQLHIDISIGEKKEIDCLALFDTGASVSLIDSRIAAKLNKNQVYQDNSIIRNASGDIMATIGKMRINIDIGGNEFIQEFVIIKDESLPSDMIIGWDFIRKNKVEFATKPLSLNINGAEVNIYELPITSLLHINKERENNEEQAIANSEEKIKDATQVKCYVPEDIILSSETMGYVMIETKVDKGDVAIFEPVEGNIGAHMLCPGLVSLEVDMNQKKARFMIQYINPKNEDIIIEQGKTIGYIQACTEGKIEIDQEENEQVNTASEKTEEERIQELFITVDSLLTPGSQENQCLKEVISKYPSVFSNEGDKPNITPFFFHTIQLDSTPKPKKPYVMPICFEGKVLTAITNLLKVGLVRHSRSPIHSPLVPILKKDGTIRLCVDYRHINNHVINDSFPLPNINNILQNLGQGKLFSCLDLKQGYHQIPLDEKSKPLTAFIAPNGLYEYNVMPMGLKDCPSAFCRIINQVLVGLKGCNVYMDDIIIQGKTLEENILNLEKVLARLQEAKLTVKLSKCEFFQSSVKYLGHIVSAEGLKPQPEKIEAITNMPRPHTLKQLQSLLGVINYYRRYIKHYAHIAAPLHKLTGGKITKSKPKQVIQWTPEAEESLRIIKDILAKKVILAFPDFKKPFYLTTDASNVAIGGVLQQKDEQGHLRPLTFFSRKLNTSEKNYSTIEREALAIVYGLKINRPLCLGFPIKIHTDHRPLTWLLTTSNANGRIARWQLLVAEFDIEVNYIPGKENKVADYLSRLKLQEDSFIEENISLVQKENEEALDWDLEKLIQLQHEEEF